MFPQELADLFDTIVKGHNKYDRDLTVLEVRELYGVDNPTATRARKEIVADILDDIDSLPHIGEDVANDVVRSIWQQEVGRGITALSLSIMEGPTEKLTAIKSNSEKSEDGYVPDDETETVPTG